MSSEASDLQKWLIEKVMKSELKGEVPYPNELWLSAILGALIVGYQESKSWCPSLQDYLENVVRGVVREAYERDRDNGLLEMIDKIDEL